MDAPLERRRFLAAAAVAPLLVGNGERDLPHVVNRRLRSVAEVRRLNGHVFYENFLAWSDKLHADDPPADLEPLDSRDSARDAEDERLGRAGIVSVGGSEVDDDWLRHLAVFDGLRRLILVHAHINGDGFRHLIECRRLELIWLDRTALDDGGLTKLAQLTGLHMILIMGHSRVTADGLGMLKALLPEAHIMFYPTDGSPTQQW